jgi:hypothetical protein
MYNSRSCVSTVGEYPYLHIIPSETQKTSLGFLGAARKNDHFIRVKEGTTKYDFQVLIFNVITQNVNFLCVPTTASKFAFDSRSFTKIRRNLLSHVFF